MDVFDNDLDMCRKEKTNASENNTGLLYRIGKHYVDNISKKQCNSITVRFTSFRKRTLVYRRKKCVKDVKLNVDLTKKRYTFLVKANYYVKFSPKANWISVFQVTLF